MNEGYLMASGAVFVLLAMVWRKDSWLNFALKSALYGMALWAAVQWGAIHGAWRP